MPEFAAQIDVWKYGPQDKHPMIFKTFEGLKPGEKMELINDHGTHPLQYQFAAERLKSLNGNTSKKPLRYGEWLLEKRIFSKGFKL